MTESTWQFLDRLGIILGLLAFVGTGYSALMWVRHFRRERQLAEPVVIRLVDAVSGAARYELPYQPPRRTVTRAEVLGLLGMIPSAQSGARFEWAWLHTCDFMAQLEDVYLARRDVLDIALTPGEFAQLKILA